MTAPVGAALPPGFRVALDRRVRVLDAGAVLIGGAPPRLVRLAPAARRLLRSGAFVVTDATSAALARRLLDGGIVHPAPLADGEGPGSAGRPGRPAGTCRPADVTVVVPVKDRTHGLRRLLAALRRGDGGASADDGRAAAGVGGILVVDDGSADAGAVREVAGAAGARVLRHDVPRGPAAARNAGAAAATTPLVAFLDSDVVPEPGWLDLLLAHFADPAVALAAPRIVALPPVTGPLGRYEAVRSSLDLGPDPALIVPRTRVAYVPSAALLVRRDALRGSYRWGFDERLHVAEDVDLVLRLHAAGWRLRYDPAARVAHDHRTTLRAWWARKAFYGTGAAPLALRHPGSVPPMVLSPWSAAVSALLLTARPRAVLAAAAVGAVAAERLARSLGAPPIPAPGRTRAAGSPLRRPRATAALLVGLGAAGAVGQTADAVTRHYWPVAALACLVSRRARRTVATVALVEGVVDWWRSDHRHRPPLPVHVMARRLDDLAYGAGLWWGAARLRTVAPLLPAWSARRAAAAASRRPGGEPCHCGEGAPMSEHGRQDEHAEPVPDAPGMPGMQPPEGGPKADPEMPDPEDVMAPRPGAIEGEASGDVKPN